MLEGTIGQKIPAPKVRSKQVHHWKEGPVGSWEGVTLKPPPAIPCYTYTSHPGLASRNVFLCFQDGLNCRRFCTFQFDKDRT